MLKEMFDQGDISRPVYANATRRPMPSPQGIRLPGDQGPAQYFANYVKQQLVDRYGSGRVFGGGLKVYTTIDLKLQKMARNSIGHWLTSSTGPTAALVSIDPRDGRVLAMFGGNNFRKSQFNLAVQGERQAGSSFKPFVLATALKEGVAPSTTFVSKPVTINAGGRLWEVHNYEDEYLGSITIQTGDRVLGQRRLRAADEARRPAEHRQHRQVAGDQEQAAARTSRSGWAPRASTRSRWRARSRRSPTAASESTAGASATSRA